MIIYSNFIDINMIANQRKKFKKLEKMTRQEEKRNIFLTLFGHGY